MRKLAVRLSILSILTTLLLVAPIVTQAYAATSSSKHVKKKTARVVHQAAPRAKDPNANPFGSNYEEDVDRKKASGGGGY